MNARIKTRLATVLAAAAIGVTGTACAAVDNATRASSSRDMQLAQADTSTTSSTSSTTSTAPSAAEPSSSTSTATTTTPSSNASTPTTSSSATTTPAGGATATPPANDQARRIFDQLDTNHDGMLSFDEFSRATFQQK